MEITSTSQSAEEIQASIEAVDKKPLEGVVKPAPAEIEAKPAEKDESAEPEGEKREDGSWVDKAGREHNADGTFKAKEAAADEDEGDDAEKAKAAEAKKPEPVKAKPAKNSPEERISKAVRQQREAEEAYRSEREEVLRLRREIDDLRRQPARAREERPEAREERTVPRETRAASEGRPKADDFENYDDYLDARDSYNRKQWEQEYETKQQAARTEAGIRSSIQGVKKALDAREKATPGFVDALSEEALRLVPSYALPEGESPTYRNVVGDVIFRKPEKAPDWLLHFTEHPEDLQALEGLGPQEILWEMGQMVGRLGSATAGSGPKDEASRAHPPLRPVKGPAAHAVTGELDEKAPLSSFVKRWAERESRAQSR